MISIIVLLWGSFIIIDIILFVLGIRAKHRWYHYLPGGGIARYIEMGKEQLLHND